MADSDSHPQGWAEDAVSEFLQRANENTFATFARIPNFFKRAITIDGIFRDAAVHFGRPDDWLAGVFLLRAHAAFLSSIRLAAAGEVPEAYMVMRGDLEATLYAQHIEADPARAQIWFHRDESAEARQACRTEFSATHAFRTLKERNASLYGLLGELYERTIDQGAHPNVSAFLSNMQVKKEGQKKHLILNYLAGPTAALQLCLRSTLQCGVACLNVLAVCFGERFEILGLSDRLREAEKGL